VFDHVTIHAADRAASERFYDTVLPTVGIEKTHSGEDLAEWDDFSVMQAGESVTRRLHVGFAATSPERVDAFWRAGTDAGYRDDGPPGPRPQYVEDYYGGFLLDPDGNSAEGAHHGVMRTRRGIDHLWIRVADAVASARFYETVAAFTGFAVTFARSDRARFVGGKASFTVLHGPPTEHLHMAFPAGDDATVDAFHRAATGAGYRDNGGPGERPAYHAGYYAAYVLDPDGNNIEVVNHNRS
jgi:catechol 2,3-dioxygenase-like lactoylglutathione lyase family enzyme